MRGKTEELVQSLTGAYEIIGETLLVEGLQGIQLIGGLNTKLKSFQFAYFLKD